MHAHHRETIDNARHHFERDSNARALLLGGSIAHGFADPDSDVDVVIVVTTEEYQRRERSGELTFLNRELATYEGGYVDGKYVSFDFLERVAARGSEPARFAFQHAQVISGETPELAELLSRIARYPTEEKAARIASFYAQLQAWHWYVGQADRRDDAYLLNLAVSKLVLFAGRLILAHNELLFPYHKWLLRVLEGAPEKPAGLVPAMRRLSRAPSVQAARELHESVESFRDWGQAGSSWPARFLHDTELGWMRGEAAVEER